MARRTAARFERNDIRQYDALVDAWWDPSGPLAMLSWIAAARSELIPPTTGPNDVLVDLGCGGGVMGPYVKLKGYRHVGVDITESALVRARDHNLHVIRADVLQVPIRDACADVVCAGEILEHVTDLEAAVAESCRVLRPGGLVIVDTLADTAVSRFLAVSVAERLPGGAPRRIHDPSLFVNRDKLLFLYAEHGVKLQLRGLRPSLVAWLAWRLGMRDTGRMLGTRLTSVLFQGWGRKESRKEGL